MSSIVHLVAVISLALAFVAPGLAQAQGTNLLIRIAPSLGPPGTSVTISGQGAPANASVHVLYAPFDDLAGCRAGRDAESVAVVQADRGGGFAAMHIAQRLSPNQAGYTYLAKLNQGPVPRPDSNLECFSFQNLAPRYFAETGHAVSGDFLRFWTANGGLPVFGYPLSDRLQENGRDAQYFERQRFEAHPQNRPPYDILLGRLGAQLLERRGVEWQTRPRAQPAAGCMYFEETGHNVCNQGNGVGFLSYWQTHGLEFNGQSGSSYAESLALFGYPLTEAYTETNASGDTVLTQWFERARFEWHPSNPQPWQVLLGRLGAEVYEGSGGGAPTVSRVNLYFVAPGDNGQSGKLIGCGDSLVPVQIQIEPTVAPLTAALERLFSIKDQFYGQSGLYNALAQSNLRLENAVVESGEATIRLSGSLSVAGLCDAPRIEEQIKEVARQFSTVNDVVVYLNGRRLEDVLSQR